ncbi:MAG: hypothetical protein CMJ18_21155 [Phycisphaeraceae bacterium]|nr:hypothetical protein [Phycisphaeraceae bacterium]
MQQLRHPAFLSVAVVGWLAFLPLVQATPARSVASADDYPVPSGNDFKAIAAGGYHSLALRQDGSLFAWGWNDYGQCDVPAGHGFVAIAAGHFHSLALRSDGSIVAWGRRADAPAGRDFVAITAGAHHSLALKADGAIVGWGASRLGRTDVPKGNGFTAIAAGIDHGLALRTDGSLVAWGSNRYGQTEVPSGRNFKAIAAGGYHNVVLQTDGSLTTWGTEKPSDPRVRAPAGHEFNDVAASRYEFFHAVTLREDGSLNAWGWSQYGQTDVPSGNDFVAVASGSWHNLALRSNGSIVGWGYVPMGPVMMTADGARKEDSPPWRNPPAAAVQTLYRKGVPHVDKNGKLMTGYDPDRSFLPLGVYGYSHTSNFRTLEKAGFNTITHEMGAPENFLEVLDECGLQVIPTGRGDLEYWQKRATQRLNKLRPHILAQYVLDEPYVFTGASGYSSSDPLDVIQAGWRHVHDSSKAALQSVFPDMPVYVNMSPQIDAPQNGWGDWIKRSDIACLDDYPFRFAPLGDISNIARSVWAATVAGEQNKPVWFIAQSFEKFPHRRLPRPHESRAAVYTAVIHGATGILYWVWDHRAWRGAGVLGMSDDPIPATRTETPASPIKQIQSRALWQAAVQTNFELTELKPVLLSPTVGPEVSYAVEIVKGIPATEAPIRALLKPHSDGGYVLLTVNLENRVLTVRFRFGKKLERARPMFENRQDLELDEDGKSFTEDYEPFDVHVFRL